MANDDDESSSSILDLTSCQLRDLSSIEFPPTLTELDLTCNRLKTLDPRIGDLVNLKKLSFRQNLLDDSGIEALSGWTRISELQVLVFSLNLVFL